MTKPTLGTVPRIRLRRPPAEKKFTPPPSKISEGSVVVVRKVKEKDPETGEDKIVTKKVTLDGKGKIIMEEAVFNKLTTEVLERRAYDNYVKTTIDKINALNKPKTDPK